MSVQQIYTGNLDGSKIVEIPQDNLNKFLVHFSPDGTSLLYTKFIVPKGSPDGTQILVFLFCPDDEPHVGVTLTDINGSSWTFIATGFGPDWNPSTQP